MAHEHNTRLTKTHVTHRQSEHDTIHTQTEHGTYTQTENDTKHTDPANTQIHANNHSCRHAALQNLKSKN